MTNFWGRALAIGLLGSVMAAPVVGEAEPLVLTESQMDEVTAGGVYVDVVTFAQAVGDYAGAFTDTRTNAFSSALFELAFGYGVGHAFACCGPDAGVNVGTSVAGYGDTNYSGTTSAGVSNNGGAAVGHTLGWVLAYSGPSRENVREDQPFLEQYAQRVAQELAQSVAKLALEAATAGATTATELKRR